MTDPVDYDLHPTTLNGLIAAAMGQLRRQRELGYVPPASECVKITPDAMLDLLETVADLRARVALLEGEPPERPVRRRTLLPAWWHRKAPRKPADGE